MPFHGHALPHAILCLDLAGRASREDVIKTLTEHIVRSRTGTVVYAWGFVLQLLVCYWPPADPPTYVLEKRALAVGLHGHRAGAAAADHGVHSACNARVLVKWLVIGR